MPTDEPEVPLPDWTDAWLTELMEGDPTDIVVWRHDDFLRFAAALFRNPSALRRFPPKLVEQLLTDLHISFALALRDDDTPLDLCLDAVVAAYALFRHWYNHVAEYSHSGDFFWDSVCQMYEYGERLSPRQQAIKDAIFRTLTAIIKLDNPYCQVSALHGFNHLKDDRCHLVIDNFLARCTDPGLAAYARLCRTYRAL
jgi:hypothetical protein